MALHTANRKTSEQDANPPGTDGTVNACKPLKGEQKLVQAECACSSLRLR